MAEKRSLQFQLPKVLETQLQNVLYDKTAVPINCKTQVYQSMIISE